MYGQPTAFLYRPKVFLHSTCIGFSANKSEPCYGYYNRWQKVQSYIKPFGRNLHQWESLIEDVLVTIDKNDIDAFKTV